MTDTKPLQVQSAQETSLRQAAAASSLTNNAIRWSLINAHPKLGSCFVDYGRTQFIL